MGSLSYIFLALFLVTVLSTVSSQYCAPRCVPQPNCALVRCRRPICRRGEVLKFGACACGCCDRCIIPLRIYSRCRPHDPRTSPLVQCGIGLCCHLRQRICLPVRQPPFI